MTIAPKALDLIEIFERNAADYRGSQFNEAMLRQPTAKWKAPFLSLVSGNFLIDTC